MPIYSYKCTNCDHRFEARQRFSDDPLTDCPVCGSTIRKVITPVGIVFKGSGFYVTDNKNGNVSSAVNGSTPTSKDKTKDTDKKVESKSTPAKSTSSSESPSASSAS
jgi:putative FmdB family regulatory protein